MGSTGTNASKRSTWKHKQVFTTGEVAEICGVSQQTIIRCVDNGKIDGFRVPGSRFRRIPRTALIEFMKQHEIPLNPLVGDRKRILVVDDDTATWETMAHVALHEQRLDIKVESCLFGAGVVVSAFFPEVVVLGTLLPPGVTEQVVEKIHQHDIDITVMMLTPANMEETAVQRLARIGVGAIMSKPFTPNDFVAKIEYLLDLEPARARA